MDYLKRFVRDYCGNVAFQDNFNSQDCKMLELWVGKIANGKVIKSKDILDVFNGEYPITSAYICHKLKLESNLIDSVIAENKDNRILSALLMQDLSNSQLSALKKRMGIVDMNHILYDKHYAPLISNSSIDYIASEVFKLTNSVIGLEDSKYEIYTSLSLTKNEHLIETFLNDDSFINEQKLAAIVNNDNIPKDIRIRAFNMGCDYTMLACNKPLPEEILTEVYHSFADAHTEHHTLWTTVDADLTFQMLAQNPFLPYECQMDYLMRWMNSRAQDHILQDILTTTTQSPVLEKATHLKSKCVNIAYDNACIPKKCLEDRFEKLYKLALKEKAKNGEISDLCVERLIKIINRLTVSKYHTDNLLSLNNEFINMNLLRRSVFDRAKINLSDLEKYMHCSNGWCRFYAALSYNIHSRENALNYTASDKEQLYEITRYLHFVGNCDYRTPWRSDAVKSGIHFTRNEEIKTLRQNELILGKKKSLSDLIFFTIEKAEIDSNFKIGNSLIDFKNIVKKQQDLQHHFNNYEVEKDKEVLKSELRGIAGLYNDTIDMPEYVYDISNPIIAMEFYESLAGFTDKIEENYKLIKEIEKEEKKTEMEI